MPVNSPRADYNDIAIKWTRVRDCYDGRDAIIRAGNKYVPDLPGCETTTNDAYRKRGMFFNATKRTVQGMVGAIFQEAPEVEFPTAMQEVLDDVTLSNISFEMFAADAGKELMLMSRFGVLIDMPLEEVPNARPFCIGYKAEDIINWRTARQGGDEILTMVVLKENVEVPDPKDPFVNKCIDQFRVLELKDGVCTVQLWREVTSSGNKQFLEFGSVITPSRRGTALDFIPFIFMGATHATAELELPLLMDLVDVNLGHWRNSVDHEWGLHLVALPTPWVAGVKGQGTGPMKMGPSVVWELEVQGQAGMLEFGGQGLASLAAAMTSKEKLMAVLGARLLEQGLNRETASAVRMRHSDEHASLRSVAQALETGFTLALRVMAWWGGTEATPLDTQANVELNKEYLNVKASPQEVQVALTALQAGEISFATWWNFLSTGGWGREGIDDAAERDAIGKDKALAPEPVLDPTLSPDDSVTPPAPGPKVKTITGPDGAVKYTITEHP